MDRYRLLSRVGTGGMSEVWRAHDDVLDRTVAVKILTADPAADPGLADRILTEARAAARLRHPNVVEVHDFGRTPDGLSFVVMELVDGESLDDLLADGPLPWRTAVTIGAQVAAALANAHAAGIVHRDVKPANVMVTTDGVKLVDFGISATAGESDRIGGMVFGTPAYFAPERIESRPVQPATDVYALGLLLHIMLSGRLPWDASTTTQMLKAHRYTPPGPLPAIAGLPVAVVDLTERCLAKQPEDRPDAATVSRCLSRAAGVAVAPPLLSALDETSEPAEPTRAIPAEVLLPRPDRRRALAGAVALLTAVLGAAGYAATRPEPEDVRAAASPATQNTVACRVGYAVRSATDGRFATAVTLQNTGVGPVPIWKLAFDLPEGQRLARGWTKGWAQHDRTLQLSGKDLAPGAKVDTGFDASFQKAATLPGAFTLNGTPCTTEMSVVSSTTAKAGTVSPARQASINRPPEPPKKHVGGPGKPGGPGLKGGPGPG